MSGTRPTSLSSPAPEPRPGWSAIVGRIAGGRSDVAVLYPRAVHRAAPAPSPDDAPPAPEAA